MHLFKNYLWLFGNPRFLEDLDRFFESHLGFGCICVHSIIVLLSIKYGIVMEIQYKISFGSALPRSYSSLKMYL